MFACCLVNTQSESPEAFGLSESNSELNCAPTVLGWRPSLVGGLHSARPREPKGGGNRLARF